MSINKMLEHKILKIGIFDDCQQLSDTNNPDISDDKLVLIAILLWNCQLQSVARLGKGVCLKCNPYRMLPIDCSLIFNDMPFLQTFSPSVSSIDAISIWTTCFLEDSYIGVWVTTVITQCIV